MNNNEKMSSSNTTPFNNKRNIPNVLNNKLNKYSQMKEIHPRNNSLLSKESNENNEPIDNSRRGLENNESNKNNTNNSKERISEKPSFNNYLRNPFRPRNRQSNTASDLRDKLDTNTNEIKDEAAKKGVEKLKNSANPYAKAAGYAASFLQNRKDKKKKEKEDKEEKENKDDDSKDNDKENDENTNSSIIEKKGIVGKLAPVLMLLVPFILLIIVLLTVLTPILNAYSWFASMFNHKSNDPESYYIYNKNQKEKLYQEMAFNDAIVGSKDGFVKGIIQEYQEEYGVTLDKYLLVATITYRYSFGDSEKIYTSDDDNSIDEEEINKRIEDLDNNDSDNSNNTTNNGIDYSEAKKKIDAVAALMVSRNGSSYTTDNTVGGTFYNTLIESNFLKTYYKKLLKDDSYESRKKLVDEIFAYADGAREIFEEDNKSVNGGVIGDTSIVHVQTCKLNYTLKEINGIKVFDNPPWNEGTNYPDYLSMKDYVKGMVYREIGVNRDYIEAMKAQAIIGLTYIIHDSRSGFDLKSGEMYFPGGTCRQATCSPTYGCTSFQEPTSSNKNLTTTIIGENSHRGSTHPPIASKYDEILEEVINEVFGIILVNKGVTSASFSGSNDAISTSYYDDCSGNGESGKCFSQKYAIVDAKNGMNYQQILAKYYSGVSYDLINVTEGLYTSVGFANANFNGNVVYYSQKDYNNVKFCGRSDATISSSGCGVTSSAIVATSLTGNRTYDPVYMMNWAHKEGQCGAGISGTNSGFFSIFAKNLGLNYQSVGRDNTNQVVEALKTGKSLVIAHMGKGDFTNDGHYIVLSGINDKGEVMVQDPNDKGKNHYWDLNKIANQLQVGGKFHIISL